MGIVRRILDVEMQSDLVCAFVRANHLNPNLIPVGDFLIDGKVIRYREVVPAPGEEDADFPVGIPEPTPDDEFAVRLTEWREVPLVAPPWDYGIAIIEVHGPTCPTCGALLRQPSKKRDEGAGS